MRPSHYTAVVVIQFFICGESLRQRQLLRSSGLTFQPTQNADVVYGVMTTNLPAYTEKVRAQLDTWAAGLPAAGKYFAVSGSGNEFGHQVPAQLLEGVQVSTCSDLYVGVTCKEERILEIGFARGAEWLVVLGEDNYVDTAKLENTLAGLVTEKPKVLGMVACEMQADFCPEAVGQKSLCGGAGYILNRAAVAKLMSGGQDSLRSEYDHARGHQGDLTTSCALRRRGIEMANLPGLIGGRLMEESKWKVLVNSAPLTYHYVTPEVMHWIHAVRGGSPISETVSKERIAFDGGCCCWFKPKDEHECQAQVAASGHDDRFSFLSTAHNRRSFQTIDVSHSLWNELEASYIALCNDARTHGRSWHP